MRVKSEFLHYDYESFLQNNLRHAIRNKRPELLNNAIVLHFNANRPHSK
jgi:uncharacterized membrane protein YhfC